jgi:hypothetical protein
MPSTYSELVAKQVSHLDATCDRGRSSTVETGCAVERADGKTAGKQVIFKQSTHFGGGGKPEEH